MHSRRFPFALAALAGLVLLAVWAAPGLTQPPGEGPDVPASASGMPDIHIHLHGVQGPYGPTGAYSYDPYQMFQPRYDAATMYQRKQLEDFYQNTRPTPGALLRMQMGDVGLRSPHPEPAPSERLEQLNDVNAPGRLNADQFDRSTGRIGWPSIFIGPDYDAYRKKFDDLYKTWATSPESGYGTANYHRIQVAATAMYDVLAADMRTQDPWNIEPYIDGETFLRQVAYEAGFRPQPAE